jgi:RHS repeat-associated protein
MDTDGLAGAADNGYTYDDAGRLTSWNNGTSTTDYGYDNNGNLTTDGSKTYTYDARDELTSDGTDSYNYTANGDLASEVTPDATETATFDAYGEQVTSGAQSYNYDALGRVVTDDNSSTSGGYTFSYAGSSGTLASDGTSTYTWDPTGTSLVGIGVSGGTTSQGVLALTDQHSDVLADFTSGGTSVNGSTGYDPWGDVTASTGTVSGQVGFQSEWTDPATGKVSMGSRWYTPGTGNFTSADTAQLSPTSGAAAANPFAYANDDPLDATDPTGHMPLIRGATGAGTAASYHYQAQHPLTSYQRQLVDATDDENNYESEAQQATDSWSAPTQSSCSLFDVSCHVAHAWHRLENGYHDLLTFYHKAMNYAAHYAALVRSLTARLAKEGVRDLDTAVSDAAKWGAHAAGAAWHTATSVTARVYHAVTKFGSQVVHAAEHVVSTAWHHVERAATATVSFVKHHAAAIASIATSAAVFSGCELGAVLFTAGSATSACGALAGAAGSAVGYLVTAAQHHDFSWEGLGEATLEGGIAGALGSFLGAGAGVLGSGAGDAASALADGALSDAAADGAADAAGETAEEAGDAAESGGSGASGSSDDPEQAQEAEAGSNSGEGSSDSCLIGGSSFTAGTLVLLAGGKSEPISKLKVGQRVLAMNPKTGKDQVETMTAVLVHHDTDLYDLKVRSGKRTAVIDTTSNHLFWVPGTGDHGGRWVKAGSLRYGTHLRTPGGGDTAVVTGGWIPAQRDGWMWDLTVPGNNDHDFYINTVETDVLVHNCGGQIPYNSDELSNAAYNARVAAGISPGRNVAAANVEGLDEPVIGFSKGGGYHAEADILDQLSEKGIDPSRITELYSERQPCSECESALSDSLAPGTPVSWSVPWGDDPAIKAASNELLEQMIGEASGK